MLAGYPNTFIALPMNFPRFRQLPPELRLKIWSDALPEKRTIHLVNSVTNIPSPTKTHTSDDEGIVYGTGNGSDISPSIPCLPHPSPKYRRSRRNRSVANHCKATVPCPKDLLALLHTCRESRLEVLCRYQPLFSPKSPDDRYFGQHYFDPIKDGVFIDKLWPWVRGGSSKPTGLYNARILSISCNAWFFKYDVNSNQLLGKGGLLRFKHLEELHIVHRILTDHEREKIMQYKFGQYMGPGDMTQFLRRPHEPHDIAFPSIGVDIRVEPILEKFAAMKEANPGWNIPKVKLMAWATRPPAADATRSPSFYRGVSF